MPDPQNPNDSSQYLTDTPQFQSPDPMAALQASVQPPQGTASATPNDPSSMLRDFLVKKSMETQQDALLQKLHMTKEDKEGRSKWGNVAQVGGNILQALVTGRNFRTEANQDYEAQNKRLTLASQEIRNADLAKKAEEDRATREKLGQMLSDSKASQAQLIAQSKADETERKRQADEDKYSLGIDKNKLAASWNNARTGTAAAKQKSIDAFNDYKMKHPNERPESFIANALTEASPDGKLNIPEYQSALNDFYKSQSLRQGPIIKTSEVPVFGADGTQTGTNVVPTIINRQTGAVSSPSSATPTAPSSVPGAPTPTSGPTIPYGATAGGFSVPKALAKDIPPIKMASDSANLASQNLLQDFGSGKLADYSGWIRGGKFMQALRNQGYAGGVSDGEGMEQLLSPTNVIQNIRSMSPRINKTEIDQFTGAMGKQGQDGEGLTRRAVLYSLSQGFRLQEKLGAIPSIPDGKGGTVKLNDTPEFLQSFRQAVDDSLKNAKTSKGMVVKSPTIQDVIEATKARIQANSQAKVKSLTDQVKQTMTDTPELDELKRRGLVK